jgi:hypothetical protein
VTWRGFDSFELCLVLIALALVLNVKSEKLGYLRWWWLGGIYSPNHQTNHWGRLLLMGAPDSPVRKLCHPTIRVLMVSTVGALTAWGTGQSGAAPDRHCSLSGAPSGAALTLHELSTHCSAFAGVRWSRPLRWSHCSAGTPDSPVNYSGAAVQKPEGEEFGSIAPGAPDTVRWHTGQSGAPD